MPSLVPASTPADSLLRQLADAVHDQAHVFAASQSEHIQQLALDATRQLFEQSLRDESIYLPSLASLLVQLHENGYTNGDAQISTRASSSKSNGRSASKPSTSTPSVKYIMASDPTFGQTPLSELYVEPQGHAAKDEAGEEELEMESMADQMVWEQLRIRVGKSLDLFSALTEMESDDDGEDGQGRGSDDEEEEEAIDSDEDVDVDVDQDEDEQLDMDDIADDYNDKDESETESEEFDEQEEDDDLQDSEDETHAGPSTSHPKTLPKPYFAPLRDPEEEEGDDDDDEDDDEAHQITLDYDIQDSPIRKNKKKQSTPKLTKGKSELDAGFFALDDFNSQILNGEEEMDRYMKSGKSKSVNDTTLRGLDGLADEDDDENEDIDYFAPAGPSRLRLGSYEEDVDEEEEHEGIAPEDMRYDDFWQAPKQFYGDAKQKKRVRADGDDAADHDPTSRHRQKDRKGKGKQRQDESLRRSEDEGRSVATSTSTSAAAAKKRRVSFNSDVKVQEFESGSAKQSAVAALVKQIGMKAALKKLSQPGYDPEAEDDDEDDEGLDDEEGDDDEGEEDEDAIDIEEDSQDGEEEGVDTDADARTMQRIHRDLLADDDVDIPQSNGKKKNKKAQQSRHERRMAALEEQIDQLEQENVAEREWAMRGEVGSRARPVNSLLEEDLEFDQVAKVVPVVTEETSQTLEDKIKKRILDDQFDDVVRRRAVESNPYLPSKLLDIKDTQSDRSLAEIYADEFAAERTKAAGGDEALPEVDAKLAKEHESIRNIFEEVCNKLDALSNAHFTPKAAQTVITTITNLPSIAMESALPTAASSATMLAPEEVYAPAQRGTLTSKSEMTPAQKKAARASARKARAQTQKSIEKYGGRTSSTKKAKEQAMNSLIGKRGVTVVGKGKAAKSALTGKKRKENVPPQSAGLPSGSASSFKL